jgi:hypothetical protein
MLRDEEAAGSNPATPTQVRGSFLVMRGGPPCFRASLMRRGDAPMGAKLLCAKLLERPAWRARAVPDR